MEWNGLEGFYYTALFGNITKAAAAIRRTQPALSRQIKTLEASLGCLLFERIGKQRIVLTDEGKRLFAYAENVKRAYGELVEDIEDIRLSKAGRIRIAAPPNTLYLVLPDKVERFKAMHPKASFALYERIPTASLELLGNGAIDFAIMLKSVVPEHFATHHLGMGRYLAVVAREHPLAASSPVSLRELSTYPLIVARNSYNRGTRSKLENAFRNQGLKMNFFLESGNTHLTVEYVRRGLGVGFLMAPKDITAFYDSRVSVLPMDHIFPREPFVVCTRRASKLAPLGQAFLDMLIEDAEEDQMEPVTIPIPTAAP